MTDTEIFELWSKHLVSNDFVLSEAVLSFARELIQSGKQNDDI